MKNMVLMHFSKTEEQILNIVLVDMRQLLTFFHCELNPVVKYNNVKTKAIRNRRSAI